MSADVLFSIVVPTYDRPERLAECLCAISQLAFPVDRFEVVITNDGGTAPVQDIVGQFSRRFQCRLVEQAHAGPGAARNAGVNAARGAFIVFTDDDCQPDRDMLAALEPVVAEWPRAAIGGMTLNALEDNIYSEASQDIATFLTRYHHTSGSLFRFFTATNLTISREIFHEVGGFSASFPLAAAEDRDFCERLLLLGIEFVYAPQVTVRHSHSLSLSEFLQQHYNYGRGRSQLARARALRGVPTHREVLSFYVELITDPLQRSRTWRGVKMSLLSLLSQVAFTSGYLGERWRHRAAPAVSSGDHTPNR